jgi:hypothetical protein
MLSGWKDLFDMSILKGGKASCSLKYSIVTIMATGLWAFEEKYGLNLAPAVY